VTEEWLAESQVKIKNKIRTNARQKLLANVLCPSRGAANAVTFLVNWRHRDTIRSPAKLSNWINRLSKNVGYALVSRATTSAP